MVHWDERVGGLREVAWLLQRDLHDAVASLRVSVETDDEDYSADDRYDRGGNEVDVRLGLTMKLPGEEDITLGPGQPRTLRQRMYQPQMEY
jgi:hypothetical protein